MDYKRLVELEREERLDPDNDKFFYHFLERVIMVQQNAKKLKTEKFLSIKEHIKKEIKEDVETLRCFVGCLK